MRIVGLMTSSALSAFMLAAAGGSFFTTSVLAACPTLVASGETQTTTQTLADNQNCTVESGGSINVSGAPAITGDHHASVINNGTITTNGVFIPSIFLEGLSTATNNGTITSSGSAPLGMGSNHDTILTNNGTITSTGDDGVGMLVYQNGTITNNGTVTVSGEDAYGILVFDDAKITNKGTITVTGEDATGISGEEDNLIENFGTITMSGDGAEGIEVDDSGNTIRNFGTVTTNGTGADAIELDGDNNVFENTGTLRTFGAQSEGVDANSNDQVTNSGFIFTTGANSDGMDGEDNNTILNTGTISTQGDGGHGLFFEASNNFTNRGKISATGVGAKAIKLTGGNNHLKLGPGSVIIGELEFDQNSNTFEVENGLNVLSTFSWFNPSSTNSNGAPQVTSGSQIAVLDISNFGAFDDHFFAQSAGVSRQLQGHLTSVREGTKDQAPFWVTSSGNYQFILDQQPTVGVHNFGGTTLIGRDAAISENQLASGYFGFGLNQISTQFDAQTSHLQTVMLGGAHAMQFETSSVNFAMLVGYSGVQHTRRVANNEATNGLETGTANYGAFFVAPEIAFDHRLSKNKDAASARAALKYIGAFVDGFSETGASDNLIIDARRLHLLEAKFSLSKPFTIQSNGDDIHAKIEAGFAARTAVGDTTMSGQLLGQNINFDPMGNRTQGEFFLGADAEFQTQNGFDLNASGQFGMTTEGAPSLSLSVGFEKALN